MQRALGRAVGRLTKGRGSVPDRAKSATFRFRGHKRLPHKGPDSVLKEIGQGSGASRRPSSPRKRLSRHREIALVLECRCVSIFVHWCFLGFYCSTTVEVLQARLAGKPSLPKISTNLLPALYHYVSIELKFHHSHPSLPPADLKDTIWKLTAYSVTAWGSVSLFQPLKFPKSMILSSVYTFLSWVSCSSNFSQKFFG